MILKHLTVKSKGGIGRLLNYMHNNPDRLKDGEGKSFLIRHNIRGESMEEWINEYLENEDGRVRTRSDSVYLNHIIISFHADDSDHISQEMLEDIAQHYINMAASDALVIAVPHREKDHAHIHLAVSGVDCFSGRSMRMSHETFAEVKDKLQEYQKERYPELEHSLVDHGRKKNRTKLREIESNGMPRTKKEQIIERVEKIMGESISRDDFLIRIEQEGMSTYARNGKLTGIEVDGKKYRFKRTLGIDPESFAWEVKKEKLRDKELNIPNSKAMPSKEGEPIEKDEFADTTSNDPKVLEDTQPVEHQKLEPIKEKESGELMHQSPEPKAPSDDNKADVSIQDHTQYHSRTSELSSIRQRKPDRGREDREDDEGYRRP